MERRRPPETAAGSYVLHDVRRIDWAGWRGRSPETREAIIAETTDVLTGLARGDGEVACYSTFGHGSDLLVLVLRDSLADLDHVRRRLDGSALSEISERTNSAVGVTEASGYTEGAAAYFDDDAEADPGIERYMESRLHPTIPDAEFVSFYFMNKRRGPEYNWYDLPYGERAEYIEQHGEIGREYAGKVTQMITGTTGFDDWEWGVTLFANDMVAIKNLLVEMRFDPSTSRFAEFSSFVVGRQFSPSAFEAFLAGDPLDVPSNESTSPPLDDDLADFDVDLPADAHVVIVRSEANRSSVVAEIEGLRDNFDHYESHIETSVVGADDAPAVVSAWTTDRAADTASGFLAEIEGAVDVRTGSVESDTVDDPATTDDAVRSALAEADVYAGQPHGEELHALVLYSDAKLTDIESTVADLETGFERYDTHEGTTIYAQVNGDRAAIVSLWSTEEAASTASGHLQELPGIGAGPDRTDGFSTMGMFYRVKPSHRDAFRDTFAEVGDVLDDMEGHRTTQLYANVNDGNDMFIASHWRDREDAMTFFRSDAFSGTVDWGRDVLAGRPRHVFLA